MRSPGVASRVGGLPEVIEHGVSGFLHPLEAIDEMAASAVELLTNPVLHKSVAQAACRRVRERVLRRAGRPDVRSVLSGVAFLGVHRPQSSVHSPRSTVRTEIWLPLRCPDTMPTSRSCSSARVFSTRSPLC